MARLSALRVDTETSKEGVWAEYVPGVKLRVARIGNPVFTAEVRRLADEEEDPNKAGVQDAITRRAAAVGLLKDITGIEDDEDQPLDYTPELGLQWFTDPEMDDLYLFVLKTANNTELFRAGAQEKASGN